MLLKFTEIGEAENADDTDNGGGVGVKALGHVAYAEQDEAARLLQDWPKDYLPLGGEFAETFVKINGRRSRTRSFHEKPEFP
jgi:hypothetical protein